MSQIANLKSRYLDFLKWRYPSVPAHALVTPNYMDESKTTNGLTKCIITLIQMKGWQAERVSSSGRALDNTKVVKDVLGKSKKIGSSRYIKGTSQNGTADISANIQGRSIKIEVKNKRTKDKLSPAQKKYRDQIEISGGVYYIATDFEESAQCLNQFPDNPRKLDFWQNMKKTESKQLQAFVEKMDFNKGTDF